jgi:polysaccharide biosynthesis protein PslH
MLDIASPMPDKRLLVISHVYPFPGVVGQQQRVAYKLRALRSRFEITFLTYAPSPKVDAIRTQLRDYVDHPIVLPSAYSSSLPQRLRHRLMGALHTLRTGQKLSNYAIGTVELSPQRVRDSINPRDFDLVLYEYWHAVESTAVFSAHNVPTTLDMHDVLWQSYQRQLLNSRQPDWWKTRAVNLYKRAEESAWHQYDLLIAINRAEGDYARTIVGADTPIIYAAMGTDLSLWPYAWNPADPPRIAYYGGLGSPHNQRDALRCCEHIMPLIWQHIPDAQFWIVGSNPPPSIQSIPTRDPRVTVTGFVQDAPTVLGSMSAVLCPWVGTYGFRSRLVEVMALGVPVIASPDAVYGMDMDEARGIFLRQTDAEMASACLHLLQDQNFASRQSQLARQQIEEKYSYEATYGKLADDLSRYCETRSVSEAKLYADA